MTEHSTIRTQDAETGAARAFELLWGAQMVGPERVRFRLWAPGEPSLVVRVAGTDHAMQGAGEGWFECVLDGIAAGTEYLFVLPDGTAVPDPAARAQAGDVHGPSIVVDPHGYRWRNTGWKTRPWEETVHYELHIGAFTPEGTFAAAAEKLSHLADLGITTVEIMPVGQFEGNHGWGYDGVLIYAPHKPYGSPDEMKAFIDAAHGHGLNVVLDVIYNHFGPAGNYLSAYAPQFFHPERHTPWGSAIAYEKRPVREFFIQNALYWLEEFHLDGLRLDAVDHIHDDESETEILVEIGQRIRAEFPGRDIHLTTEDNRNVTRYHPRGEAGEPLLYSGEWNDDFHNVAHAIATGETEGYYVDFIDKHWWQIARCLAEGFAFQGEGSRLREGETRGEPSGHLPPTAFVDFIQNHDQVGNRAFGERLIDLADRNMVETLLAMLLLSPHIPLLFMGEEWGETRPFAFFTDFEGELADAVREGRRREFSKFSAFHGDAESLKQVPDPNAASTFEISRLNWNCPDTEAGQHWMALTKRLLKLRAERIVPHLYRVGPNSGQIEEAQDGVISVTWRLTGAILHMIANLDDEPRKARTVLAGEIVYASSETVLAGLYERGELPARTIVVTLGGEHQDLVPV